MERGQLREALASLGTSRVKGRFERHQSLRRHGFEGSRRGGRWGARGEMAVLYLGRPRDSVVAEAYRHLVDGRPGMTGAMVAPRRVLTVAVRVERVLDLRGEDALEAVGLSREMAAGRHGPCQRIAAEAHQAGFGGVLAESASGLAETLAVFSERRFEIEVVDEEIWSGLPADPRQRGPVGEGTSS